MKNISNYKNQIPGGNKSSNLEIISKIKDKNFIVPQFIVANNMSNIKTLPSCDLVAVRSDSSFEDGGEDSGAGVFETLLNVKNYIDTIESAYNDIQSHAHDKIKQNIPVIIQEMVNDSEYAGVIFTIDTRSDHPDYFTLNYTEGLGNNVVDGNRLTINKIIHKDYEMIDDSFEKKIILAVKQIITCYNGKKLDIEFAYKGGIVYILQVRPITALQNDRKYISNKVKSRLFSYLSHISRDKFLGDMIDINPVELLGGSRDRFINTFFNHIFPKNALLRAREEFGYGKGDGMDYIILDKTYIDLEKNIRSFLPASLSNIESKYFLDYYKELLVSNPSLQNQMDTVEYPINFAKSQNIIDSLLINQNDKNTLIDKFKIFFNEVELKSNGLADHYLMKQNDLIEKYFPDTPNNSIGYIHDYVPDKDIITLLQDIKELCYEFALHARAAFYLRNQSLSDGGFYNYYVYYNQLSMHNQSIVPLSKGFNLLEIQDNIFNSDESIVLKYDSLSNPVKREMLEVARENIKYMFMNYITKLGLKIQKEFEDVPHLQHADFDYFIKNINNKKSVITHTLRRKYNNDFIKNIQMPSTIFSNNHPGLFELLNAGIYFDFGLSSIEGNIVYINDIHQYSYDQVQYMTNGKIVLFVNATTEIDSYLPYLTNAIGLITQYGGPGAHIVTRIREMNNNLNSKIGLVVGLGEKFEELILKDQCKIDFHLSKVIY